MLTLSRFRTLGSLLIAVSLSVWLPPAARGDDWPQWLGPQRDSVWREAGVLRELPAEGPDVVWRVPIQGGYAGPAVAGNRLIVTDYVTEGDQTPDADARNQLAGTERVLCFSTDDGQLLWEHAYDCPYNISYPAGPRTTPVIDGDRVYTLGAEGHLLCLNLADGAVIWQRALKDDYDTETPVWGYSAHPLIDGDLLFCVVGGDGSVAVAFDKQTGQERWRALSASEPGYCPPTLINSGGTRQLIIWHAESLNGLDPRTGRRFWSQPLKPDYGMAIATPRQAGNLLFVGAIKDKSMLVRLANDRPAAELVWLGEKDRGIGPAFSTPLIEGDYLYGVDRYGDLCCVRLSDGQHMWSTFDLMPNQRSANSGSIFMVKNGDRHFILSETGELIIAQLSPQRYREISRSQPLLEPTGNCFGRPVVWSHPAFAQRSMFARNDEELIRVSLAAE